MRRARDDGSVAVTLALSVTMLLVLIGVATTTLTHLAHRSVLQAHVATLRAQLPADVDCADVVAHARARLPALAGVECVEHAGAFTVDVIVPAARGGWPDHTVSVVIARDR